MSSLPLPATSPPTRSPRHSHSHHPSPSHTHTRRFTPHQSPILPAQPPSTPQTPDQHPRWLARLRAAISNPAPDDDSKLFDSLASQLNAHAHPPAGGGGDEETAAFLAALANAGPQGMETEMRWKSKVYASSTSSIDEIVVDNPHMGQQGQSGTGTGTDNTQPVPVVPTAAGLGIMPLFYAPPPSPPPPHKPPDTSLGWIHAILRWVWTMGGLWGWIGRRAWPRLRRFFDLSFWESEQEDSFRRDSWFAAKQLAFTASLFYILNTLLAISLIPRPLNLSNKITYFGVAPLLTVPIPFLVQFNAPRFRWSTRLQWTYQPLLLLATWCWSWFSLWDLWSCGYYKTPTHPLCGNKDFLSLFYFATALPVLALFALGQHRTFAALGALSFLVIMCVLVLPERTSWVRNVVNFAAFQAFLIYVHYMREQAERRVFMLREQLKAQFKVTEKAQELERRASDSKKRFVSYIFHEVRVPLNTALLAVQNLAPDVLALRGQDDIEFGALEGSLNMMSKVLNDVLDFNRMDSGRFESTSHPFCFHNVIRTMLIPLELAAEARGLSVSTSLDRAIDDAANRAAFGEFAGATEREGWVLGDEMRLRQLVTNLTSNACKFTGAGGRICVRTSLVGPAVGAGAGGSRRRSGDSEVGGAQEAIVVRIEVQDTGVGIRPRDILANQLFSPYVQTEIGRYQGGKGTGLGLALVRHIVKLSGGRLGLKSKVGHGSTFWVELALGVGRAAVPDDERDGLAETQVMEMQRGRVEAEAERMSSALSMSLGIMPSKAPVDASLVEGATPSSHASVGMGGPLLDTPSSEDSAMRTIMEHGGMVELMSRRYRPAEPSPTKQDLPSPLDSGISTPRPSPPMNPPDPPPLTNGDIPLQPVERRPPMPTPNTSAGEHSSEPPEDPLPVLVVDDDNLTRRLMARLLTRLGCAVDVAENGQIALEMLLGPSAARRALADDPAFSQSHSRSNTHSNGDSSLPTPPSDDHVGKEEEAVDEHKYGVVFLDNQMPFYSGVQVVYKLRELARGTFVVGVTGNALQEDQQEYHDAGVDHILTKPVLEKDLRAMVSLARDVRRKKLAAAANGLPPRPPDPRYSERRPY